MILTQEDWRTLLLRGKYGAHSAGRGCFPSKQKEHNISKKNVRGGMLAWLSPVHRIQHTSALTVTSDVHRGSDSTAIAEHIGEQERTSSSEHDGQP